MTEQQTAKHTNFHISRIIVGRRILLINSDYLYTDTINPLAPDARRNFHPAQARWEKVPDRPHAYSLQPNSYIWIASSEVFSPGRHFPREFTLFVSLRLRPEVSTRRVSLMCVVNQFFM